MLATAGVDVLYLVVSLANKGKTMQQVGNQMNNRSMGYLATKIWYIQCAMDSAPVTGQAGEKNRLLAVEIIYLTLMLLDKLIHFMCLEKAGCFFFVVPQVFLLRAMLAFININVLHCHIFAWVNPGDFVILQRNTINTPVLSPRPDFDTWCIVTGMLLLATQPCGYSVVWQFNRGVLPKLALGLARPNARLF